MIVMLCLAIVRIEGGSGAKLVAARSFGILCLEHRYLESMDGVDLVSVTTGSSLDPKSQLVFN